MKLQDWYKSLWNKNTAMAANPAPRTLGNRASGSRGTSGYSSVRYSGDEFALAFLDWAGACINFRARAFSALEFKCYEDGGYLRRELNGDHWLPRLLQNPNPNLTPSQFYKLISQWYDASGNCFVLTPVIDRQNGIKYDYPTAMHILPSSRMAIRRGTDKLVEKYIYYSDNGTYEYDPCEILHFKNLQPGASIDSQIVGVPKTRAVLKQMRANTQAIDYVDRYLANNTVPPLILKTDSEFENDEEFQLWRSRWNESFPDSTVQGILEKGWELVPLITGDAQAKGQILSGSFSDDNLKAICAGFGVPLGLLTAEMNNNALTDTAGESLELFFNKYTLSPEAKYFQEEITLHMRKFDKRLSVEHTKYTAPIKVDAPRGTLLQTLQVSVGTGQIKREAAIETAILSLGYSRDEATKLFPDGSEGIAPQPQPIKTIQEATPNAQKPTPKRFTYVRPVKSKVISLEPVVKEFDREHFAVKYKGIMERGETDLLKSIQEAIADLGESVVNDVKHKGVQTFITKRESPGSSNETEISLFNIEEWQKYFEEITEPSIKALFLESLTNAIEDVGENMENVRSRFDESNIVAMKASTDKITTAPQTIHDSLVKLLENFKDRSPSEITDAIKTQFKEVYGESNARRIAQTTSTFVTNRAQKDAWKELGYTRSWIHNGLGKNSRPSHSAADGQLEDENGNFSVGGEVISQPGEGSAENCINCYCTTRPVKRKS